MMNADAGTARKALITIFAGIALLCCLATSTATAATSYTAAGSFSTGTNPTYPFGNCQVNDLDVDAQENVYAHCGGQPITHISAGSVIKKFDKNGNPVNFTYSAPWISGNTILYDPNPGAAVREPFGPTFQTDSDTIAVDRSSGATAGYIYVSHNGRVEIFNPAGKWMGSISGSGAAAPDIEGNIYTNGFNTVLKYDRAWTLQKQFNSASIFASTGIAIDSTGSVWGQGRAGPVGEFPNTFSSISKFEPDQFGLPVLESLFSSSTPKLGRLSPYVSNPLKPFGSATAISALSIDVDLSDDTLFVFRGSPVSVIQFSPGTPSEKAHQIGGPFTAAGLAADGMAVGPAAKTVYVASGVNVTKFAPGPPLPVVRTPSPPGSDVGHVTALVKGKIELAGGGPITSCQLRYGATEAYGSVANCNPDPAAAPPGTNFNADTDVSVALSGLNLGSTYHYAFVAKNATGEGLGIDRTFRTAAVLNLQTDPATEVTDTTATLNGALDPDGMATTYYFEYGLAGETTQRTEIPPTISSTGQQTVSLPIANLKPGAAYTYRIVAKNSLGTTQGPNMTFKTAGPPVIAGIRATEVGEHDADLNATINPSGYPTTYRFEYGTTTTYGTTIPVPPDEGDAGEGTSNTEVLEHVDDLQPGFTYHFRVIAKNQWGESASTDTTFNYLPQSCPNEHVRQQMKSSFLPDCRAYELVSPENMGGVQIFPGNELFSSGSFGAPETLIATKQWVQNTGRALGPARFMYHGGLGAVEGIDAPNVALDAYLATRTDRGWVTTFPGLKGTEGGRNGRKMCAESFDICLDHRFPNFGVIENPAYVFNAAGEKVGYVPTNVKSIPNGENFTGDLRLSPDGNRFVFSSNNVPFVAGGLTTAPGSAYVNDLQSETVTLISRLPNGDPIGRDSTNAQEFITLPPTGVSEDGSHILMQTEATEGPSHLYMRVNGVVSYDIANGAAVRLVGMTADGSSVLFLATQQLVVGDSDEGIDLYRWNENGGAPTLEVLSQGNGQGNSDGCEASWTSGCSITTPKTARGETSGYTPAQYAKVALPGTDSRFARENGAVYFFSPENLAGDAPLNGRNLYLARDGSVQYVATFGGTQPIDRIQISPDGAYAGILTSAQLTAYDNAGFREMYAYDALNGKMVCASCIPTGEQPRAHVEASQNGPFMADDGRVFFSTSDRLVPGDVDTLGLPDVYEYVDGRPQLISSGVSTAARTPGGANFFATEGLGLESVSANGVDVYFATTDSLVPQDKNGQFSKIYNARTNGGFEPGISPLPCVAADECHGPDAEAPPPLEVGTGSTLTGGNLKPASTKKVKKKNSCSKKKRKATRRGSKNCKPRRSR